jgi:hypothetical protein
VAKGYEPLDPKGLRTVPLGQRQSKVRLAQTGRPWKAGGSRADFLKMVPEILPARTSGR